MNRRNASLLRFARILFVGTVLLAGCQPSAREQQLQATVDALAAQNATLAATAQAGNSAPAAATESATESATATPCPEDTEACAVDVGSLAGLAPSTDTAGLSSVGPAVSPLPTPALAAPGASDSLLPRVLARMPLAEGDATLADFRLDGARNVAYLTDAAYQLYVVDLGANALLGTFDVSGERLLLDVENGRLYIFPQWPLGGDAAPAITIFDTEAGEIVGTLPGSRVSVDGARNRVYVGDIVGYADVEAPGVRLYDGVSGALLAQSEQAGDPLYNPFADELVIVYYSAWTADPETLAVREDLAPDISDTPIRACNGCSVIDEAFLFAEEEVLALRVVTLATGGGAGQDDPLRYFDAATMQPADAPLAFSATCSSRPVLRTLRDGRLLEHEYYQRYVVHNNLLLTDAAGETLVFKDGLDDPFLNPTTGVAYVQDSYATSYVLDGARLTPLGTVESLCFFAHDAESDRLYATDARRQALVVLAGTGGEAVTVPAQPALLDERWIEQIAVSPGYAEDATLFLRTTNPEAGGQALLRSTDGGATWTQLGGLPVGSDLVLTMALSPAYPQDQTLFAGGYRNEANGAGVWRSDDGGDTWQPRWEGLEHLRVERIEVSPRFADDQTLLAYARYALIEAGETGYSVHRSDDGGLQWTRVVTATVAELLPAPTAYLPIPATAELPVRKTSWSEPLEVRVEGGGWEPVTQEFAAQESLRALLQAPPAEGAGGTDALYVVTDKGVYRTQDGGRGWQAWDDARLEGRNFESEIRSAAVTPRLSDGSYQLLVGTAAGELWQLDPATLAWRELVPPPAPAAPSVPVTATVAATPIVTPAATSAITPAITPAAAATPAITPTVAPTPTATPAAPPTPTTVAAALPPTGAAEPLPETPPEGLFVPEGILALRWLNDPVIQQALGYATSETAAVIPGAYQFFEHGTMLWRGDTQQIYVAFQDGTWEAYDDLFREGEPERDPNLYTPGELLQPIRGFGKLWRTTPGLQDRVGWARVEEEGANAEVLEFERGILFRIEGLTYAFFTTAEGQRWLP